MPTDSNRSLTASAAQLLHDAAAARGQPPMWFVSSADPAHPGKVTARAFVPDHHGGVQLPGVLVAATLHALHALHAMMPVGLVRQVKADYGKDSVHAFTQTRR